MTRIDAQVHVWIVESPERSWPPEGVARRPRPTPLGKMRCGAQWMLLASTAL
jgi:hypothetical protein